MYDNVWKTTSINCSIFINNHYKYNGFIFFLFTYFPFLSLGPIIYARVLGSCVWHKQYIRLLLHFVGCKQQINWSKKGCSIIWFHQFPKTFVFCVWWCYYFFFFNIKNIFLYFYTKYQVHFLKIGNIDIFNVFNEMF